MTASADRTGPADRHLVAIGRGFLRARRSRYLSQRALAGLSSVPQSTISRLENGRRSSIRVGQLARLVAVLGHVAIDTVAVDDALALGGEPAFDASTRITDEPSSLPGAGRRHGADPHDAATRITDGSARPPGAGRRHGADPHDAATRITDGSARPPGAGRRHGADPHDAATRITDEPSRLPGAGRRHGAQVSRSGAKASPDRPPDPASRSGARAASSDRARTERGARRRASARE